MRGFSKRDTCYFSILKEKNTPRWNIMAQGFRAIMRDIPTTDEVRPANRNGNELALTNPRRPIPISRLPAICEISRSEEDNPNVTTLLLGKRLRWLNKAIVA